MISPLVSKVNNPSYLADFAAHRDCSTVEAALAARNGADGRRSTYHSFATVYCASRA
jgi:hypothetical protein